MLNADSVIPGKHQSKDGGRSYKNRSLKFFKGYYTNLFHTGDTKEADNLIDKNCTKTFFQQLQLFGK